MASRKTKSGGNGASFASEGERVMDQAKEGAEEVMGKAREKAGEAAEKAQQQAKSQLSIGKDRVADSFDSVAQALRSSNEQMGQEAGFVGDYMSRAADRVSEISEHLRRRDVNELIHETEDFARREPTIFMAGAFTLGLLAARFLRSSGGSMQGYDNAMSFSGNRGYSEDDAMPYDTDGADDVALSKESGAAGLTAASGMAGVGRSDDQPLGGAAGMPGLGVMGDSPFNTSTGTWQGNRE
jgi:ElaB/YqjD/DUF883 family membrane-anchored ribosome-binding protein